MKTAILLALVGIMFPFSSVASSELPGIRYQAAENTIVIEYRGKAGSVTFPDVFEALGRNNDVLSRSADGIWTLRANLYLAPLARLTIGGSPEVRVVRLESNPEYFVWVKNDGGTLEIRDVLVTSWDSTLQAPDSRTDDGRSFIMTRVGDLTILGESETAHTNIVGSVLQYLGFKRPDDSPDATNGVSWRGHEWRSPTGDIVDSVFAHNFIGIYTKWTENMRVVNSSFYNNDLYGLKLEESSKNFLIEGNRFYANGAMGLVLALRNSGNTIRQNDVYDHRGDGIYLFGESNANVIEQNRIWRNRNGIVIAASNQNTVSNNDVRDNQMSGILLSRSAAENIVESNTIYSNSGGVGLAQAKRNRILANTIIDNWYGGVRVSTHSWGNVIRKNRFGRNDNGNIVQFVEGVGDVTWRSGLPFKVREIYLTLLNYLY